jgi:GTP:adenosylcobinamide-phosphate guanylyltransferase
MNAIVLAGGTVQPKEPLYEITGGGRKAMLEIGGKPMVQWVIDALCRADQIEQIVVVGLPPESSLDCTKPCLLLGDQGNMMSNVQTGARELAQVSPESTHAMLVSADIPALRPGMVDWLAHETRDLDADVYYTVIQRETMNESFPGSRRTYVRLKDMEVCGGDCHCFRLSLAISGHSLWKRMVESRKSPLRQASLLGYDTLFFLLLHHLTLSEAEEKVSQKLNIRARAVLSPFAEMGMDVDKPYQLKLLRDYLETSKPGHGQ